MSSTVQTLRGAQPVSGPDKIRVMVVDDAVIVRSLLSRWINEAPGLHLAASLRNGIEAIERLDEADPDVVVLDVEMPGLDGISTLPKLLARRRDLVVIMASALTRDHAEVTLKALSLGAADYIPKPAAEGGMITSASFRRELVEKIRALGVRRRRRLSRQPLGARRPAALAMRLPAPAEPQRKTFKLRPFSVLPPRVLLIGASTGGPQVLTKLLPRLSDVAGVAPILITQHMPPMFTTILAEHLSRIGGRPVREATHGEPVVAGRIYLAPGGKHMTVARQGRAVTVVLDDGPPMHFCRPAVDPLFASAAEVWGSCTLGLILTGMGVDGTAGAAKIVAGGGSVIAQDEATSAVWGMPGSAVAAGVCAAVTPLDQIASRITRMFLGAAS
jgi:two-component system chemotaxis response regulator CheB